MQNAWYRMPCAALLLMLPLALPAQTRRDARTDDLTEKLLVADLGDGVRQEAVLSVRSGEQGQTILAVLLPGTPGVLRAEVVDGKLVNARLAGNPLVRARRFLLDAQIALLTVDCRSDAGPECRESYQASPGRGQDLQKVIALARKEVPGVARVWLVGHSAGTLAAAFMGRHDATAYAGIVHMATISEPYKKGSYRSLGGFDYGALKLPQVFIHHKDDPCFATPFEAVASIARKYGIPLVTVHGGGDFRGGACEPYSQHGFRGMEGKVMREVVRIMTGGPIVAAEIR